MLLRDSMSSLLAATTIQTEQNRFADETPESRSLPEARGDDQVIQQEQQHWEALKEAAQNHDQIRTVDQTLTHPQGQKSGWKIWRSVVLVLGVIAGAIWYRAHLPSGPIHSSTKAEPPASSDATSVEHPKQQAVVSVEPRTLACEPLFGHSKTVISVAFSPDGTILASGSFDKTVRLWKVRTGELVRTITNNHMVNAVAFSPDGQTLAVGADEPVVKLWKVQTGRLMRTLIRATDGIVAVTFSPDGKALVCGGSGKTVKIWDVQTGALKRTLTGHRRIVYSVVFSPDGKGLASGSYDGTARLWDVKTWSLKRVFVGRSGEVRSVAFSPDGATLAAASSRGVKLWDVKTGRLMQTLAEGTYTQAVAFSPDGAILVAGDTQGTLLLWDTATWTLSLTVKAQRFDADTQFVDSVDSMVFSPDGSRLAHCGQTSVVKLCSLDH
jgi:WD40 repeat protein